MRPERQLSAISSRQSADGRGGSQPTPTPYCQRGFSLLEIVMVVAIIGLMAGTFTPLALHLIGSKKGFASRDELQALKKAIIGDPLATRWGSEATFGYIGDMGNLPTNLQDLYTQPAGVSSFSLDATLTIGTDTITPRIGSGWRGPYVAEKSYSGSAESLQDPYKNTYSYSTTITTDATLGAEVRATIRSPGPNRTNNGGTQDDLTERILTTEVLADVAGIIKDSEGVGVPTVSVSIIYPSGSSLTSASATTDDEGRYPFSNIPIGQRAIFLQPGLVYVPGTAYAGIDAGADLIIGTADDLQEVEFRVANLSSSSVAITSTKATYNIVPTTNYTTVKISNVNADGTLTLQRTQTGTFSSGATVGFASVAAAASTLQREPFRFLLQSSRIEIPDIELTTIGADSTNGTKAIELQGFANSMAGISFKIEFSNGSKAIFTPRKQS